MEASTKDDEKVDSTVQASEEPKSVSSDSDNGGAATSGLPQDFQRGLRFWGIIIGLGVTNLLGALENTVVTTAAPVILTDLRMGENFIWITNAFFVCRCVGLLSLLHLWAPSRAQGLCRH